MPILFSREHQWIDTEHADTAPVGITVHAQDTLGDIVFVELPAVGAVFKAGAVVAVVESVKAASDVFAPISGTVTETNADLEADPALVNTGAETGGWFFKVLLNDVSELDTLLDEAAYKTFVAGL